MTITINGAASSQYKVVMRRKQISRFCTGCKIVIAKPTKRHVVKSLLKEQAIYAHSAIEHAKFGFGV